MLEISMYLLLKFAYLGTKFEGYQVQPDKITVEGEILKVLKKYQIADFLKSSSRTDRSVSALGNVIKISTNRDIKTVFSILNSQLKYIYFYSYSVVTKDFNPRITIERSYRYYFLDIGYDFKKMKDCASMFLGIHDFAGFSKHDIRNSIRTIKSISIKKVSDYYVLEIVGESFLWNMVRRIVGAVQQAGLNKIKLNYIKDSLINKVSSKFMAKTDNLILVDVKYDLKFKKIVQKEKMLIAYEKSFILLNFYKSLLRIEGR